MTFSEYLISKKINETAFQQADNMRYLEWKAIFTTSHPDSFTTQKKFLINDMRRQYPIDN